VDDATSAAPAGFMVNCAHTTHLGPTLRAAAASGAPWLSRFRGLRANASAKTHAELDDSTELDRGDPAGLARDLAQLRRAHAFTIVGGCCGTDAEHLRLIAEALDA
jgi:S-methylmethionine-dependent homocysteine/selenocysteine methylase